LAYYARFCDATNGNKLSEHDHLQPRRHPPHEHWFHWTRHPLLSAARDYRGLPHPSVDPARSRYSLADPRRHGPPSSTAHHPQGPMVAWQKTDTASPPRGLPAPVAL